MAASRIRKSTGRHPTPLPLAAFLARLAFQDAGAEVADVLDPACGDGRLLGAVLDCAGRERSSGLRLTGIDLDEEALSSARGKLRGRAVAALHLVRGDFLLGFEEGAEGGLWPPHAGLRLVEGFDLIIANPPYVRTQVLGAARSRRLSRTLGLSDRVDLYHAFVAGMARCLRPGGRLALLCSNRFLTTRSGSSMRGLLRRQFKVERIIDLGDTGLFSAAVLPAIVIARKNRSGPQVRRPAGQASPQEDAAPFMRILRHRGSPPSEPVPPHPDVLQAIAGGAEGLITAGGRRFVIDRGTLELPDADSSPWTPRREASRGWSARISEKTAMTFGAVLRIRVGLKTTADAIFIRRDWTHLQNRVRPEPELLRPLLTHEVAAPYLPLRQPQKRVLYPHTKRHGRRCPVDLARYPGAAGYLQQFQERLAAREYLRKAGRQWYELWVSQDPEAWGAPKLVLPDISEQPRCFLDESGALVNGDCYWLTTREGVDHRMLLLVLAVANSSLGSRFYDEYCSNRLYSGRRRYITQYLSRFPLPDISHPVALRILDLVSLRLALRPEPGPEHQELERRIDSLVWQAFGLEPEPRRSSVQITA
ncbi:MAG: N-6 DNA methylase [Planctomycetota bacterium]